MYSLALAEAAERLQQRARALGLKIVTAESCTGGLIAACLTEVAGSSDVLERGFVTYSNEAKTDSLGVPAELIARHGAVSGPVARAMAEGALRHARAGLSVAVTGIAGPGGGTPTKPVGLVFIAAALASGPVEVEEFRFEGDRQENRLASVKAALELLDRMVTRQEELGPAHGRSEATKLRSQ